MTYTVEQPTSVTEAIALLAASPLPVDSPTQRRYRGRQHLEQTFDQGRRRPEWVWCARAEDGSVGAVVAGLAAGPGIVLDHLGAAAPDALPLVLRAATEAVSTMPEAEATMFVPAELIAGSAPVRPWIDALEDAGWRVLVERVHYEFAPAPDLAADVPAELELRPLTGPDDPRLTALMLEVTRGTLDAHDRATTDRVGLEAAAEQAHADLLGADPWECLHLAYDGPRGPVGCVSWRVMPGGRSYLLFVGVASSARGRGYGRQLVALGTRGLIADGAAVLIADTDATNTPMVDAFAQVGWQQTETRIDLTLAP